MESKTLQFYAENAVELADRYNAVVGGISKYFATAFIAGSNVLDIGCGLGRDLRILHEMGYRADGIDGCEEFIESINNDLPGYGCIVTKDILPELATVDDKNRHKWSVSTSYRAPHKMLLLLSIIELIELDLIKTNFIEVNPELLDTFDRYWSAIMPIGSRGNIFLPFFHMESEGFWTLQPKPGKEDLTTGLRRCDSFRQLNKVFLGADLDQDLFLLMQNENSRKSLRAIIFLSYFDGDIQHKLALTIKNNSFLSQICG